MCDSDLWIITASGTDNPDTVQIPIFPTTNMAVAVIARRSHKKEVSHQRLRDLISINVTLQQQPTCYIIKTLHHLTLCPDQAPPQCPHISSSCQTTRPTMWHRTKDRNAYHRPLWRNFKVEHHARNSRLLLRCTISVSQQQPSFTLLFTKRLSLKTSDIDSPMIAIWLMTFGPGATVKYRSDFRTSRQFVLLLTRKWSLWSNIN